MRLRLIAANLAAAIVTALPAHSASAMQAERSTGPSESRIPVGNASLYARVIGRGQPVIVLHGGPDFDHGYLLPDLDRLKDGFRLIYLEKLGAEMDRQREILASAAYQAGDPEAVTARYRIHFKPALKRPEDYEKLMARMKAGFSSQGKEGILKARAVEDQLMDDTWEVADYDLLPKLRSLRIPTLVITGDHDFIPVEVAEHIARAIPNAKLVTLKDCGHFTYLECAGDVRKALDDFFSSVRPHADRH